MSEGSLLNTDELFKIAKSLDKKGYTIEAVEKYKEILDIDPNYNDARIRLAFIYEMIGGKVSMNKELDAAMDSDPSSVIMFDEVFYGDDAFSEHEMFRHLKFKDIERRESIPGDSWNVDRMYIGYHTLIFLPDEENKVLMYRKPNKFPEYLVTKRRCSDGYFYNYICRFSDGKQFRTDDRNGFTRRADVFRSYINTIEKEFEMVCI